MQTFKEFVEKLQEKEKQSSCCDDCEHGPDEECPEVKKEKK